MMKTLRASFTLAAKFQVCQVLSNSSRSDSSCHRTVYKIPPLKANEGHRAQEWGDLAQPLWKGRIRIIERGSSVALQFEDAMTGEFHASHLRLRVRLMLPTGERM